jgi:hypothetical protein
MPRVTPTARTDAAPLAVEVRVDVTAPPSRIVQAVASLILQRARDRLQHDTTTTRSDQHGRPVAASH